MADYLDETISCPICCERYGTPKALPCMHTFCLKCLEKQVMGAKTITCSLCNAVHRVPPTGVKGFRTNFALDNVVKDIPKFREAIQRHHSIEDVTSILQREVNNLKHLVQVVHTPLLRSVASLKRGERQQQEQKTQLVTSLFGAIIDQAKRERDKHLEGIKRKSNATMKYFEDVEQEITRERDDIESFCSKAERKTQPELEKLDLNSFMGAVEERNRSGRRVATEYSHLAWTDVNIAESKDQVRMVRSNLGSVIRVHVDKRSHRPRIGTMESDKHARSAESRRIRSKSDPHADAISNACLPSGKKLSDPVKSVVDSVMQRFRQNGTSREGDKEKTDNNRRPNSQYKRQPMSTIPQVKSQNPPPYPNGSLRRTKSEQESIIPQASEPLQNAPRGTSRFLSVNSETSVASSTLSRQGPQKPPRTPDQPVLHMPCGISVAPGDRLVIAERGTGKIRFTDQRGLNLYKTIHPFLGHADEAKAHALFDLTVLPHGDIAVTDTCLKKVMLLMKFNNYSAPEQLHMPHDMVPRGITSNSACLYVGDAGNGCVQVYTHIGKHCSTIELDNLSNDRSSLPPKACPHSVAVSPGGHILVSDLLNCCLYLVLRTGEISRHPMQFKSYNGVRSSTPASQAIPNAVCWLNDRHALITEDESQEILLVNIMTMELVHVIKRREFSSIQGVAVNSIGQVLVTDGDNHCVHVIQRSELLRKIGARSDKDSVRRSKSLSRVELDTLV